MGKTFKDYCMNCESKKHRLAFIHIPRTAGKSIRLAFKLGYHDKQYNRINEFYPCAHRRASVVWTDEIIDDFDTFTVIRDPWSRLVSLYHYYLYRHDVKNNYEIVNRYKNFSEFVTDLKNIPMSSDRNKVDMKSLSNNFQSCSYWVCDDAGKVLVKNLIRFDKLNEDLAKFIEKINMDIKLPLPKHIKKYPGQGKTHKHYTEYYDNKLIQKVADFYEDDIRKFGFEYK